MNTKRRKEIEKTISVLEQVKYTIKQVNSDEEDAFNNLPEAFQFGDQGEAMEEAMDAMEDACDSIDSAMDSLHSIL